MQSSAAAKANEIDSNLDIVNLFVRVQEILHFRGINVLAPSNYHVLGAPDNATISQIVKCRQVSARFNSRLL